MGYITAFFILFIAGLLGKVVVSFLGLQKSKHTLVYGLFAYFSGFFIFSGPFTFLQLHWNLYFLVMTLYNFAIIGLLIYAYIKKIITISFSLADIRKYLCENWVPLGMILFFVCMNFAFNNLDFGPNTSDDVSYLSWATKNIGNTIFHINFNPIKGTFEQRDFILFISFWEMFWGYTSQLLHIDLIVFVRTTLSIVMYVWVFYTIDEIIYVMTDERQYKRFKYTILVTGLMYYVNGMQSELYKFMQNPWFGNVFSYMLYLSFLLLFFYLSLTNKKALYLLFLLPFISVGFSPVSILYVALTFLPIILLWQKNKRYAFRHTKKIIYLGIGISLAFLSATLLFNSEALEWAILTPGGIAKIKIYSEYIFFQWSFRDKLMFMVPGIAIFFYRLIHKKVKPVEKYLILFILSCLLISLVPKVNTLLFILFSFPYRRVLDSYMIALVFYSAAMILSCLPKVTISRLLGLFAVCTVIFYQTCGLYFLDNQDFKKNFDIRNLLQEKRLPTVTKELEDFLEANVKGKTNVCLFGDRFFVPHDGRARVDLSIAIAVTQNAYYNCALPADKTEAFYYVTDDPEKLYQAVGGEHLVTLKKIETDQLKLGVYEFK